MWKGAEWPAYPSVTLRVPLDQAMTRSRLSQATLTTPGARPRVPACTLSTLTVPWASAASRQTMSLPSGPPLARTLESEQLNLGGGEHA